MPVMIYVSFFVSILYYYGIMQIVVKKFGLLLQATLGTTACESISASGNIFLGMVCVTFINIYNFCLFLQSKKSIFVF